MNPFLNKLKDTVINANEAIGNKLALGKQSKQKTDDAQKFESILHSASQQQESKANAKNKTNDKTSDADPASAKQADNAQQSEKSTKKSKKSETAKTAKSNETKVSDKSPKVEQTNVKPEEKKAEASDISVSNVIEVPAEEAAPQATTEIFSVNAVETPEAEIKNTTSSEKTDAADIKISAQVDTNAGNTALAAVSLVQLPIVNATPAQTESTDSEQNSVAIDKSKSASTADTDSSTQNIDVNDNAISFEVALANSIPLAINGANNASKPSPSDSMNTTVSTEPAPLQNVASTQTNSIQTKPEATTLSAPQPASTGQTAQAAPDNVENFKTLNDLTKQVETQLKDAGLENTAVDITVTSTKDAMPAGNNMPTDSNSGAVKSALSPTPMIPLQPMAQTAVQETETNNPLPVDNTIETNPQAIDASRPNPQQATVSKEHDTSISHADSNNAPVTANAPEASQKNNTQQHSSQEQPQNNNGSMNSQTAVINPQSKTASTPETTAWNTSNEDADISIESTTASSSTASVNTHLAAAMQDISATAPVNTTQGVNAPKEALNLSALNVLDQVVEGANEGIRIGKTDIVVKLSPEDIGDVKIHLSTNAQQQVTARLVVDNPETQDMLKQQMNQLKQHLESQGLQIEKVSISLAAKADSSSNQNNSNSSSQDNSQQSQQQNTSQQSFQNNQQQQAQNLYQQFSQQSQSKSANNPWMDNSSGKQAGIQMPAEEHKSEAKSHNPNGSVSVLA